MKEKLKIALGIAIIACPSILFAAHPLITDDTGTQGKGKLQIESNYEYGVDKDGGDEFKSGVLNNTISFGISENVDGVFSLPYMWWKDGANNLKQSGISDISVQLKYKFYENEKNGVSFGIKPGFSIPSGDEKKGLGSGRMGYSGCFIVSKEFNSSGFHLNLGYSRNENKLDEKKDIYNASIAGFIRIKNNLNIVWDIGTRTNTDKGADNNPAYAIMGFIYSLLDNFDIDAGVKRGITSSETDWTYLFGLTWRY